MFLRNLKCRYLFISAVALISSSFFVFTNAARAETLINNASPDEMAMESVCRGADFRSTLSISAFSFFTGLLRNI